MSFLIFRTLALRGLTRLPLFDFWMLVNREKIGSSAMSAREKIVRDNRTIYLSNLSDKFVL